MKVLMKLSRRHPNNAMNFGRHIITPQDQALELNKAEIADLKNEGPKYWFIVGKADEIKIVKSKAGKKVTKKAA